MPQAITNKLMIISDLDGSLLDHHSYQWQAAAGWLNYIRQRQIPLVFCTSKTVPEVLALQQEMQFEHMPYICENGAVLGMEQGQYLISHSAHSQDYRQLQQQLGMLRKQHGFKFLGFGDVSEQQVMAWTGLDHLRASWAKQRLASEPICWQDTAEKFALFRQCLAAQQLTVVQGGRFWHVMNAGSDKYQALQLLLQRLQSPALHWHTIGLGDSPNDLPFLQHTDYSVVIHSKHRKAMQFSAKPSVYFSQQHGARGWAEGLDYFSSIFDNNDKE
jgi:mannosyl-3-phosphoglycerate phosphatase